SCARLRRSAAAPPAVDGRASPRTDRKPAPNADRSRCRAFFLLGPRPARRGAYVQSFAASGIVSPLTRRRGIPRGRCGRAAAPAASASPRRHASCSCRDAEVTTMTIELPVLFLMGIALAGTFYLVLD